MAEARLRPDVPEAHTDAVEHRRVLAKRVNAALLKDGSNAMIAPIVLASYADADLPDPSLWTGGLVTVASPTGSGPAYSTGAGWVRLSAPGMKNALHYGAESGISDTTSAIQDALDDVAAGAITILPPGLYNVSGLTVPAAQTLWLLAGAILYLIDGSDTHVVTLGGEAAECMGAGTINGNRANQAAASGSGIYSNGYDRLKVSGRRLHVTECADRGVYITDGSHCSVYGVRTTLTTRMGIQGRAFNLQALDDFTVERCHVDRSDDAANNDGGIEVTGDSTARSVARARVLYSTCLLPIVPTGSSSVGIELFGPTVGGPGPFNDALVDGCSVVGGTIGISLAAGVTGSRLVNSSATDCDSIGMEIANSRENTVAACTVDGKDHTPDGIVCNNNAGASYPTIDNELNGNVVKNCTNRSIFIYGSSTAHITINGGQLSGAGDNVDGVFVLESGGDVVCNGVGVNFAGGTGTTARRGFVFNNSSRCSFRNGQVKNAYRAGQIVANDYAGQWYRIAENDFVGCTNPGVQKVTQGTGTINQDFIEKNMGDDLT